MKQIIYQFLKERFAMVTTGMGVVGENLEVLALKNESGLLSLNLDQEESKVFEDANKIIDNLASDLAAHIENANASHH